MNGFVGNTAAMGAAHTNHNGRVGRAEAASRGMGAALALRTPSMSG